MPRESIKENRARLKRQTSQLYNQGRIEEAIAPATELCKFEQTASGSDSADYATSLNNLATLYRAIGDYEEAESLHYQALHIREKFRSQRPLDYAQSLNNLGFLYFSLRDYNEAYSFYRDALDIRRQVLGEQHPRYAESLSNLAGVYYEMGDYEAAVQLDRQALDIRRHVFGKRHLSYAVSLNHLAMLHHKTGPYEEAESLYREVFNIIGETLGEWHPYYIATLNNLATLYSDMGYYKAAEPLYRKGFNIIREARGERHPDYAEINRNLAALYAATGRTSEAFALMIQAAAVYDDIIAQVFSIGSESQRMAYLLSIQSSVDAFLSLVSQQCPPSDRAVRAAMDLVLRRKAMGAEALAAQRDAVLGGKYPALLAQLQQLRMLKNQIAQTMLAGPGPEGIDVHRQRLNEWDVELEHIEAKLARQIPEMSLERHLKEVDHRAVAEALPQDTTLIEFVRFETLDFTMVHAPGESSWQPPHYLAFVLRAHEPGSLAMIDLGKAERIDRKIAAFRMQVTGEDETRSVIEGRSQKATEAISDPGANLRITVFDPLIPHLAGATHLLIAPDGELTRLPFETLPIDDGHLIDRYHISYLSVGRDVLRLGLGVVEQPTDPVVIADPDFDLASSSNFKQRATVASPQSRDLTRTLQKVPRLPGTAVEGKSIADMLKVTAWLEKEALERPLKGVRSPRIVHLATHGFFLKDRQQLVASRNVGFADRMLDRIGTAGIENPLIRSGLVLAGVNTWLNGRVPPQEAEDGVLTALDVSALDLTDTVLVVLSACETGLGDILVGEGVFGLRRAVMLAGAKTLIMSLWKVPDEPTKELMIDFYARILKGEPRADALRNAQLTIKAEYPDPYYWGAFICQGDPGPLA